MATSAGSLSQPLVIHQKGLTASLILMQTWQRLRGALHTHTTPRSSHRGRNRDSPLVNAKRALVPQPPRAETPAFSGLSNGKAHLRRKSDDSHVNL